MKIATFNAASVRARLSGILEWLAEHEPDVLAIQETKVENEKFPISEFEDLGYTGVLNGQKSWNGVATFSRIPATNVSVGFGDELFPNDARIIACEVAGVKIVNTYVPNGTAVGTDKFEYKLRWLDRFAGYLRERYRPDENLVWLGDINIAPTPNDVYNSERYYGKVGHHPLEFAGLKKILEFGLEDVFRKHHQGPGHYTYWDFVITTSLAKNFGWRIDHIYATEPLAARCTDCFVDRGPRSEPKPSDHTYVVAEFDV